MRVTENYELNLLDEDDFVNREDLNENTEKIDEVLESLENPEHDTGKQAEVEELASGESLKVALRKLAKAVADYISHKADKVAHITAEERTVWNAKLGTEKIAANLTTDTDGMVLAAAMGRNLKEQIDTNANAISTLNSNIDKKINYGVVRNNAPNKDNTINFNFYNTFYSILLGHSKVLLIINSEGNTSENFVGLLNFSHANYYNVSKISSNGLSFLGGNHIGWLTFKRDDTTTDNTYSITAIFID